MRYPNILRFVALTLALSLPAAAAAQKTAEGFVKDRQVELMRLIKQESSQSSKKIQKIFNQMLDYDALARASLADHWDERSDAERKEFQNVLRQLVQRAYRKNLDKTADYEVRYRGESKADQGYLVRTVARSRKNARQDPISIDYLVRRVDGSWRVHDIVTEGSSLVNNYRRQFSRIIKKKGFDELMRRMKRKLAEEKG